MFRSDFVATEPEKFTRNVLNLGDAQSEAHQPGADRHQAATHQPKEPGAALGGAIYEYEPDEENEARILLMILAFRMRNWKGLIAVGTAGA